MHVQGSFEATICRDLAMLGPLMVNIYNRLKVLEYLRGDNIMSLMDVLFLKAVCTLATCINVLAYACSLVF